MMDPTQTSFTYRGQSGSGLPVSGTIEAADHEAARRLLTELGVQVTDLARADRPLPRGGMQSRDFHAFNQQLAHLTEAGLPIERGLRLIAQEATSRRFAQAVTRVANEVEAGRPLGEAFAAQRSAFPPLYGRLVDAGIAARNLPAMLFNLNGHVEMVQRLRNSIWHAAAYPLVVVGALCLVLLFLSIVVLPQFAEMFQNFDTDLPSLTRWLMSMAVWGPVVFGGLLVLLLLIPLIVRLLRWAKLDAYVTDAFGLPLPLIGPVLRKSLVARWCDASRVGIEAGMDLPASLRLASQAIASPGLQRDTDSILRAVESGGRIGEERSYHVLTAPVAAAMELGVEQGTLAMTLQTLARMYREQAETRVGLVQTLLAPLLLLVIGVVILFVVLSLFLPLITVVQSVV